MTNQSPTPMEELPEPLREIVQGIISTPVPDELIREIQRRGKSSRFQAQPTRRSGVVVILPAVALGLCFAVLWFAERPTHRPDDRVQRQAVLPASPPAVNVPPPSLWAYHQAADSPETLDALLNHHATALLPSNRRISDVPSLLRLLDQENL